MMRLPLVVTLAWLMLSSPPLRARDARSNDAMPDFSVVVEPPQVMQGGVLSVVVRPLRDAKLKDVQASFSGRSVRGLPWQRGEMLALLPVSITRQLGQADVSLVVAERSGRQYRVQVPVTVIPGDFDTDELGVGRQFTDPSRTQRRWAREDGRFFQRVWARASESKRWRGSFASPMTTPVTATFGTFRTLNNKTRSRHLGVDQRGRRGDPIRAINEGTVVLARNCFYSGNSVVIDHGADVHSLYFHLNAFKVKQGDRVRKGQEIGSVGATGRVTGPHLHWAVKIARTYVNPSALLALDLSDDPATVRPAAPRLHERKSTGAVSGTSASGSSSLRLPR